MLIPGLYNDSQVLGSLTYRIAMGKSFQKIPKNYDVFYDELQAFCFREDLSLLKSSLLQTLSIWDKHISTKELNSCSNDFWLESASW